jgi:hypothetical protein
MREIVCLAGYAYKMYFWEMVLDVIVGEMEFIDVARPAPDSSTDLVLNKYNRLTAFSSA